MSVAQDLRRFIPSLGHESCNDPAPFGYKAFQLKLVQDGRFDAHPDGVFRVVKKYLNHHIILHGTDQQLAPCLPKQSKTPGPQGRRKLPSIDCCSR